MGRPKKQDPKGNTGIDNTGEKNSGDWNSGNWNSGNWNSGDWNSGNWNSGNWNSGNRNSGNWNSGNWNSGNRNSGDWNSGDWNSGYGNSGNRNSGDWNSGDWNSGDWNSGDWNSGYGNSGNWNSGNRNSGYGNSGNWNSGLFCTVEPLALSFNKPTTIKMSDYVGSAAWPDFSEMNPCVWVDASIMTEAEKAQYPTHKTTGGFIRKLEYKEAWAVWKRKCTPENWKKILALPNFDATIWESITGIKVEDNSASKRKAQELEEEAEKMLAKARELRESL